MAESIKFRGATFTLVEAAGAALGGGHKKCAKGTHWNDKSHSCKKLPPGLKAMRNKAHALSAHAEKVGRKAEDHQSWHEDDHEHGSDVSHDAAAAHNRAANMHWKVSDRAKSLGYPKLHAHHKSLASQHADERDMHRDNANEHDNALYGDDE